MSDNLELVSKPVDTSLAEHYLKKNKPFWPIGYSGSTEKNLNLLDKCNNRIICYDEYISTKSKSTIRRSVDYAQVAQKLIYKTPLICQLEYMLRGIPVNETKVSMELIVQHFLYWSTTDCDNKPQDDRYAIDLNGNSFLLALGDLPPYLWRRSVTVRASKDVAVVAHLFTTVCNSFGADIKLSFVKDEIENQATNYKGACIGVITEHSDMDSAVDAFRLSPTMVPWKLNKILVQESIYEEFIQIMDSRCTKNPNIGGDALASSTVSFLDKAERKLFLIDCVDPNVEVTDESLQIVIVESYRTVKELISMLKTSDVSNSSFCNYVSLWSSVMSESYEIAFNIPTRVVWINDYGTFYGPSIISRAIFQFPNTETEEVTIKKSTYDELQKLSEAWKKMTVDQRKSRIKNAVITHFKDIKNQEIAERVRTILTLTSGPDPHNFFHIDNGRTCIGLPSASGVLGAFNNDQLNFAECIKLLFYGSSIIWDKFLTQEVKVIFKELYESGVPLSYDVEDDPNETNVQSVPAPEYMDAAINFRVVLSNFGTIFAN